MQTVLIVDDDPQQVELISRMLQSAGEAYHPLKALGGEEALARLRREPVDLVLLDLMMPEVSGLMVLQAMKADPALAQHPGDRDQRAIPRDDLVRRVGLSVNLVRAQNASIAETLNCLQALAGALPPRVCRRLEPGQRRQQFQAVNRLLEIGARAERKGQLRFFEHRADNHRDVLRGRILGQVAQDLPAVHARASSRPA